jgi:hypothetical protein
VVVVFPQSVLPLKVRIAPGAVAADPATWSWVDITQWVRVASGVTVEWGRSDSAARADPSKATMTLDNRDGRFSRKNPLGPWYGRLVKGTPLRIGTIAIADTFTRVTSNSWGNPDSGSTWGLSAPLSAWSVNGTTGLVSFAAANVAVTARVANTELLDLDAQFVVSVPAVMTGASMVVATQVRWLDNDNYYWLTCEFDPAGAITTKIRRNLNGGLTDLAVLAAVPGLTYTAGTKLRVQVQADGPALRIRIWPDGSPPPQAWTLTATDTTIPTAGQFGFLIWRVAGNTNPGTVVVSIDDLEVEAVEYTGQVYEWPPRWDKSGKDATVPITASGILRRLQQGKSPIRSPLARALTRWNPVGYWRLEDGNNSTSAASALSGGQPATARAVEWAQDTPQLYGAQHTAGITTSTVMSGAIPAMPAGDWSHLFFVQLLAPPAANTRLMAVTSTGTVRTWAVEADSGGLILRGYDATGTLVVEQFGGFPGTGGFPDWIAVDLYVFNAGGGNVTGRLLFYGVTGDADDPTMYFVGQTITGTPGRPTQWAMAGSLGYDGGRLAHVAVYAGQFPFVSFEFAKAANGHIGETAAERAARLCAEENVQIVVEPGDSERMGVQGVDTFLNLLYTCEDVDPGILYERGSGLGFRPRGARYNRPVELAFDFDAGDVAEAPEPADDDQRLKNSVTVSRPGGSEATSADLVSIEQTGLLDDPVTINVESDDVLTDHAAWRRNLTTSDDYRWPSISLNLARNTGHIRLWRRAGPIPRLTVVNPPDQIPGTVIDQIAEGHVVTFGPFGWDIGLQCSPAEPWQVGIYDDPDTRYDSRSTVLKTGVNAAATALTFRTSDPLDVWSTTETPYDVEISGERLTVTAMGAASLVSGAYDQPATVTRAVNGIHKDLPAGEEIHYAPGSRYAL